MQNDPPKILPKKPRFCSGPCAKHPGWSLSALSDKMLSRGHRSDLGVRYIRALLDKTRKLLGIPSDHRIMFTPGSATGAISIAMWNFLGERPVDIVCNEVFSERWAKDILKLNIDANIHRSAYGLPPKTKEVSSDNDVVFVWNGTSSGTTIADLDWISDNHKGLTLCDATSAAFCTSLPWDKLDLTCFSLQKSMGGEAGVGILVVSDRAFRHLESYSPEWPVPYILSLKRSDEVRKDVFEGGLINTPSLMTFADYESALNWAESNGGAEFLYDRAQRNFSVINEWVNQSERIEFFIEHPKYRSVSASCVEIRECGKPIDLESYKKIAQVLSDRGAAYDILGFGLLPPMLRVWTGPTVEAEDLKVLTQWLDWAIGDVCR